MKFNLAFIGFGTVGQGLTEILINKKDLLKNEHHFDYSIVVVSDIQKGYEYNEKGLDPQILLNLVKEHKNLENYHDGIKGWDSLKTINESNANVIIELSFTDVKTGEPATTHVKTALQNGKHVITSNKGPSALFHQELMKLAKAHNVFYKIEGTVMSGTPVINTALQSLAGCSINRIKGILNGTTNYILTNMELGKPYEEVLQKAQELGYAEADPTGDVEGWDALAKVIILANVVMGGSLKTKDAEREGITKITLQDIEQAKAEGARWKLIGEISRQDGKLKAKVAPQKLPLSDPLANIMGATNAITFETDLMGPITVIGAGAGRIETGFSILTDLLDINRSLNK